MTRRFCTISRTMTSRSHRWLLTAASRQHVSPRSARPRETLAAPVALLPPQGIGHRCSPPRHAIARIQTNQTFHRDTMAKCQAIALKKCHIDHLTDPASLSARQTLFDLCQGDSSKALRVLRASLPEAFSSLREPVPHTSAAVRPHSRPPQQVSRVHIRQCPVRGIWPKEALLSAARWVLQHPGLTWTITPCSSGEHPLCNRQPPGHGGSSNPPDPGPRSPGLLTPSDTFIRDGTNGMPGVPVFRCTLLMERC